MIFEEIYKVLRRITKRYVGNRFEHDELVNQCWLSPWVRNAETERNLVRAGKNAITDYMRQELGRNINRVPQRLGFQPSVEDEIEDAWMDFDTMSSGLNRTQKLVLKLRADWFTHLEIAKVIGVSHNQVDNEMRSLRKSQKLKKCL